MYLISAEGYKNAKVDFLKIRKTDKITVSMKNLHNGLGVKNMSDLVLKEIYRKYERKSLTKNETKKYKMTERGIFENYANLSENELNKKDNKKVYVRNDVITSVIIHCRGEKTRRKSNR